MASMADTGGRLRRSRDWPTTVRLNGRETQNVLTNFAAFGTDAALLVQRDLTPVVLVFETADRFIILHGRLTGRGKLPQRRSQQTFETRQTEQRD